MKRILYSILILPAVILVTSIRLMADCPLGGLNFWPDGKLVYKNSVILIEGSNFSQKLILELNKKYPIFLRSDDEIIPLRVDETLIGEAGITQAILIPVCSLTPGMEYQLHIDHISETTMPSNEFWNSVTRKYEFPKWKAIKVSDFTSPLLLIKPELIKKSYTRFGCGPEYYVYFNFQALDISEIIIKVSVTSLETGKTTINYIIPDDSITFKIGRGMCSGSFGFYAGKEFEANFDIMDASGNITKVGSDKIKFTKPGSHV